MQCVSTFPYSHNELLEGIQATFEVIAKGTNKELADKIGQVFKNQEFWGSLAWRHDIRVTCNSSENLAKVQQAVCKYYENLQSLVLECLSKENLSNFSETLKKIRQCKAEVFQRVSPCFSKEDQNQLRLTLETAQSVITTFYAIELNEHSSRDYPYASRINTIAINKVFSSLLIDSALLGSDYLFTALIQHHDAFQKSGLLHFLRDFILEEALREAIEKNQMATAQLLLTHVDTSYDTTLIACAAKYSTKAMMELLFSHQAPISSFAIEDAAAVGNIPAIEFLHDHGASLEGALPLAIAYGQESAVKRLLDLQAPFVSAEVEKVLIERACYVFPSRLTCEGNGAIDYRYLRDASIHGRPEIFRILTKEISAKCQTGFLAWAVSEQIDDLVKHFLDRQVPLDEGVVKKAIDNDSQTIARRVIGSGNFASFTCAAIGQALLKNRTELVNSIPFFFDDVERPATVAPIAPASETDFLTYPQMILALQQGSIKSVQALFDKGSNGLNIVKDLALKDAYQKLRVFLDCGITFDWPSIIQWAVSRGNSRLLQVILEYGIPISANSIQEAFKAAYSEVACLLIRNLEIDLNTERNHKSWLEPYLEQIPRDSIRDGIIKVINDTITIRRKLEAEMRKEFSILSPELQKCEKGTALAFSRLQKSVEVVHQATGLCRTISSLAVSYLCPVSASQLILLGREEINIRWSRIVLAPHPVD